MKKRQKRVQIMERRERKEYEQYKRDRQNQDDDLDGGEILAAVLCFALLLVFTVLIMTY